MRYEISFINKEIVKYFCTSVDTELTLRSLRNVDNGDYVILPFYVGPLQKN